MLPFGHSVLSSVLSPRPSWLQLRRPRSRRSQLRRLRLRSLALLWPCLPVGALGASACQGLDLPVPPDTEPVQLAYREPTGQAELEALDDIAAWIDAQLQGDIGALCGWGSYDELPCEGRPPEQCPRCDATAVIYDLLDSVRANVGDDLETIRDPSLGPIRSGSVRLRRKCRRQGLGNGTSEDGDAKAHSEASAQGGELDMTTRFDTDGFGQIMWGDLFACHASDRLGQPIIGNAKLQLTWQSQWKPSELIDLPFVLRYEGSLNRGGVLTDLAVDLKASLRAGTPIVFRVRVGDGDVLVSYERDALLVQGKNGTFFCPFGVGSCVLAD